MHTPNIYSSVILWSYSTYIYNIRICNDINEEHTALVIVMMVIACVLFEYSSNMYIYVCVSAWSKVLVELYVGMTLTCRQLGS